MQDVLADVLVASSYILAGATGTQTCRCLACCWDTSLGHAVRVSCAHSHADLCQKASGDEENIKKPGDRIRAKNERTAAREAEGARMKSYNHTKRTQRGDDAC